MRAYVLRLNPDTRQSTPYSKYPTAEEYKAIHESSPMDGFHEAVNFLPESGIVKGYLPPRHSTAMRSNEPFALVTITAKSARLGADRIIGFQVGCLHQGQNQRSNVPEESRKLKLLWHYICPASLSFLLPNSIPNARKQVVGSSSNWFRGPTYEIKLAKFLTLLKVSQGQVTSESDRIALDCLGKSTNSQSMTIPVVNSADIEAEFEAEVNLAIGTPLGTVRGNPRPTQVLVSSFQY